MKSKRGGPLGCPDILKLAIAALFDGLLDPRPLKDKRGTPEGLAPRLASSFPSGIAISFSSNGVVFIYASYLAVGAPLNFCSGG